VMMAAAIATRIWSQSLLGRNPRSQPKDLEPGRMDPEASALEKAGQSTIHGRPDSAARRRVWLSA
jgi:hypothetical protein